MRWCHASLRDFLHRWRAYIAAGVFVLASSSLSDSLMASIAGLLALTVWPMLWALRQPPWLAALVTAGYGIVGFMVCRGMRPLLWSAEWRDVEAALPIPPGEQRRSDVAVVVVALAPLFALYLAGILVWRVHAPAPDASLLLPALALLLVSMVTAVVSGMWLLQSMRRDGRVSDARPASTPRQAGLRSIVKPTSVCAALVVLALVRRPARRGGRLLLLIPLLAAVNLLPIFWPSLTPAALAALAPLVLLLTTRLNAILQCDLAPLHAACAPLPLDLGRLRLWRCAVAMLPATVTLALLLPVLLSLGPQLRAGVAAGYLLAAWSGNLLQILGGGAARARASASARVALWLLIVLVQITLATEIMAK